MTAICEAFDRVVTLAEVLGVTKINELDGAWIEKIDSKWTVAINGKEKPVTVDIPNSMGISDLKPLHMAIFYNGWLAGLLTLTGGTIAAGSGANENSFIKAVETRISVEELSKEFITK